MKVNNDVTHTAKQIVIAAAVIVAAVVLVLAAGIGWWRLRQSRVVKEYEAQGLQMVEGCNGGAAVGAQGQVHTINQLLEDFADASERETNIVVQLQSALVIAQEKLRILGDDCRRRGHRDTHPWKTNWATIDQTLADAWKKY